MKILYIHQYFSTPAGSVGTRSYEFGRRLAAEGHEVTVLCGTSHLTSVDATPTANREPRTADHPLLPGLHVRTLNVSSSNRDPFLKRAWAFLGFALRATWHAVRADCDLVYASSTPLTVGLPALAAKCLRGRKMIFEVRDLWPELPRAMGIIRNPVALWLLDWFEGLCYRNADACIGLSPGIVEGILKKAPGQKVALIPNGCDLEVFGQSAVGSGQEAVGGGQSAVGSGQEAVGGGQSAVGSGQEAVGGGQSAVGSAPDDDTSGPPPTAHRSAPTAHRPPFTALFCGAHGRANGLDAVLDAAAVLKRRGRGDIGLLFIGDGQLKPALKDRAGREGLDNCSFIDPVPKSELAAMMGRIQVGLMILADIPAFRYGTSPNKFFDYLAAGLPVLCNYPGWVADLIRENDCGRDTLPGDAEAFADALEKMADDPARLAAQGENSRKLAEREFDRDKLFERLKTLIESP